MIDNDPAPQFSDDELNAFLTSAEQVVSTEDETVIATEKVYLYASQKMQEVGYTPYKDTDRAHEELDYLINELRDEYTSKGLFYQDEEFEQEARYLVSISMGIALKLETIVLMEYAAYQGKDFPRPGEELLDAKRKHIAEAIIIDNVDPASQMIRYMNAALPGEQIDLSDELMQQAFFTAVESLAIKEREKEENLQFMMSVLDHLGMTINDIEAIAATLTFTVRNSELESESNVDMSQREARVAEQSRNMGLTLEQASKLLDFINVHYPLTSN